MPRAARTCAKKNCPCKATNGNRCADHAREYEAGRGTRIARGYGKEHVAARLAAAPDVERGVVRCWRCKGLIEIGEEWDLGHDDAGLLAGPEHARRCNRRAAALKGHNLPWRAAGAPESDELAQVRAESLKRAQRAAERRTARLEARDGSA